MAKGLIFTNLGGVNETTTPFVYLIGWPDQNCFYIGVRTAKGCHPSDMWVRYFTSSVAVHQHASKYGPPPVIDIISTHDTARSAIDAESSLLRHNKVNRLNNFMNISAGRAFSHTPEQNARRAASLKVAYQDDALRAALSERSKEAWRDDYKRREATSARFKGRPKTNLKTYDHNGAPKTAAQIVKGYQVTAHQFQKRINQGWDVEAALNTPVRKRSKTRKIKGA